MLNRPSKAFMARIVEAIGALVAALTKPFVSHDVGYAKVVPGQKSRKVRNHMLKSPFKSVIARTATFALVLSLAIAFATVGLAPSASAQQADGPSCEANSAGTEITCSYDENGTDPVADFTAMDPEGQGVDWDLDGPDASKFTIDGGVLSFKKSPSFEPPESSSYEVTVRATEVLGQDDTGPANYTDVMVTVNIEDVDEDGKVTFDYLQPQEGTAWTASLSDPDGDDSQSWQWSVAKVSRPAIDNDQHWTNAKGGTPTSATYTPLAPVEAAPDEDPPVVAAPGEKGEILRVKVSYSDAHGDDKVVYAKTDVTVRSAPESNKAPKFVSADGDRTVSENAKKGQHVGNPVTATRDEDLSLLTYRLVPTATDDAATDRYTGPFTIDAKTGQIKVNGELVDADLTAQGDEDVVATFVPGTGTDPGTWTYTMFVMARDPSAVENDGVRVDDDGDTEDINEEDVRETPFEVTITVKEVNEKPVVRQADEGNTNDPGILVVSTMEISTVCIKENRPLAMEDDDATEDVMNLSWLML